MTGQSRMVQGPLGVYAVGFRGELALLGYSAGGAAEHVRLLGDLSAWLAAENLAAGELDAGHRARFLGARIRRGHRGLTTAAGAGPLLGYLAGLGVIPAPAHPVTAGPAVLDRYRQDLVSQRGLTEREVARHLVVARMFAEPAGSAPVDWAAVTTADVTRFVVAQCSVRSRPSACKLVSELRSFLRFVHLDGWTLVPLAQVVPPVAGWGVSSLPRWVAPEQVEALLAGCDRRTAPGRRDFAMLVVMSRLGLRAREVAAIQLGDINWRAGEIVVHGKGRREERMPLPHDVGEAIASYLQHGRRLRPVSRERKKGPPDSPHPPEHRRDPRLSRRTGRRTPRPTLPRPGRLCARPRRRPAAGRAARGRGRTALPFPRLQETQPPRPEAHLRDEDAGVRH